MRSRCCPNSRRSRPDQFGLEWADRSLQPSRPGDNISWPRTARVSLLQRALRTFCEAQYERPLRRSAERAATGWRWPQVIRCWCFRAVRGTRDRRHVGVGILLYRVAWRGHGSVSWDRDFSRSSPASRPVTVLITQRAAARFGLAAVPTFASSTGRPCMARCLEKKM